MPNKITSLILLVVFLHGSIVAQDPSQPPAQTQAKMQEVLHKAQAKDKAVKVTLTRKIDNRNKLTGKVSEISDTGFTFTDQKTKRAMQLAYADVREVKQKGMSKTAKILLAGGIVVGVAIGLGFALACSSEGGPNC